MPFPHSGHIVSLIRTGFMLIEQCWLTHLCFVAGGGCKGEQSYCVSKDFLLTSVLAITSSRPPEALALHVDDRGVAHLVTELFICAIGRRLFT